MTDRVYRLGVLVVLLTVVTAQFGLMSKTFASDWSPEEVQTVWFGYELAGLMLLSLLYREFAAVPKLLVGRVTDGRTSPYVALGVGSALVYVWIVALMVELPQFAAWPRQYRMVYQSLVALYAVEMCAGWLAEADWNVSVGDVVRRVAP